MRVLQIIDGLGPGGKERQFVELLKGFKRRGNIECSVVIMSDLISYDDIRDLGFPIHILKRRVRYDPAVFFRLYGIVRAFRPDVAHSWNAMCSIYMGPVARLSGVRFVNGYVRDARKRSGAVDKARLVGQLSHVFSDAIVSNSQAGLVAYRVPAAKAACVYNGFDQTRVTCELDAMNARTELRIETPLVVGMVGAFDRHKDYDAFFRMARRICDKRADVTFLAVGTGSRFAQYDREISAAQYANIRLLGYRNDIERIVSTFSVGVLVSHDEGIANAIMEYMASGKPVVATDSGGTPELVENEKTGFLIPELDSDALQRRVLELLDNVEKARAFGAHGKERIATEFSLEKMTGGYLSLYRRVIGLDR